jgi:hypothetical protein
LHNSDFDGDGRLGVFVRTSGYLRKWLLLGVLVGVIAGLGAVVFYLMLKCTGEFLLGYLAGYHVPTPWPRAAAPRLPTTSGLGRSRW